jgi:hypothetical protein
MSDSELSELTLQEFVGGTTKVVDLVVQSGGVAVNITGWTFEVTLFAEHVTPFDLTTGAGTEITDAAAGKWRFTIPAASTSGLGSVKLSFYVKYTLDGVTYSLGKGEIKVLPAK